MGASDSDEVDMFGRVSTREGWFWRIRSSPDGPIPWSFSNNGDLLKYKKCKVVLESRMNNVADLERESYPEETLPAELLR